MKGERRVSGLWCSEVLAKLYDYLEDQLPAADRTNVEGHLAGCSVCSTFGGRAGAMVKTVRSTLGVPDPLAAPLERKLVDAIASADATEDS